MSLIFAIGDIHGSLRKLQSLMQRCERYAEGRPMAFIFLGDYIDRGPESAGVVGYLLDLQSRMPERVIALKGNHEAMVLGVIDGTVPAHYWLAQGGTETLQSYGASSAGELPNAHVDWLRTLRLSHNDGRRFFVHAGIDPEKPLDAQQDTDLIWIREPFLSDRRDHGRLDRPWPHPADDQQARPAGEPAQHRHRRCIRRPSDRGGLWRHGDQANWIRAG